MSTRMISEHTARGLLCPLKQHPLQPECDGSQCMWWQWDDYRIQGQLDAGLKVENPKGYCGAAKNN